MKLHLLSLPHTITNAEHAHCAFTGKVLRFSPMLRARGFHVTHYGVGGSTSGANENVEIMSRDEQEVLRGYAYDASAPRFVGDAADVGTDLYRVFNSRLRAALLERVEPHDVICLPLGHAHTAALDGLGEDPAGDGSPGRDAYMFETGVGYPETIPAVQFRAYESQAWYHWHLGRDDRGGFDYNWVIPNYYDLAEWTFASEPGRYLLYFGRIHEIKGLPVVVAIAKARPDLQVVICGQGDPRPYLTEPNITYRKPVTGAARSELLGGALVTLCPSSFVEPFAGVAVESMLCGTPVLSTSYGAFTETIAHGVSGYRCRTFGDWLAAIEHVEAWGSTERLATRTHAERYDMYRVGAEYENALGQIADLAGAGWYTRRSTIGPVTRGVPALTAALAADPIEDAPPDSDPGPMSAPADDAPPDQA